MSKKTTLGLLGSNGVIGSNLMKLIDREKYYIISSGRYKETNIYADRHMKIDINETDKLTKFIEASEIVVNCVGPSYMYSEKVFNETMKKGKIYIDPYGDDIWNYSHLLTNKAVLYCGDCPGFTGLLLSFAITGFFEKTESLEFCYKPHGHLSLSGLYDMLESVYKNYGKTNHYYLRGKPYRSNDKISKASDYVLLTSNEIERISLCREVDKIVFKTVFSSCEDIKNLEKLVIQRGISNSGEDFLNVLSAKKYLDLFSERKGDQTYKIRAIGFKNGNKGILNIKISTKSSELISAYILKECIDVVQSKSQIKLYMPSELLSGGWFIDKLVAAKVIRIDCCEVLEFAEGFI